MKAIAWVCVGFPVDAAEISELEASELGDGVDGEGAKDMQVTSQICPAEAKSLMRTRTITGTIQTFNFMRASWIAWRSGILKLAIEQLTLTNENICVSVYTGLPTRFWDDLTSECQWLQCFSDTAKAVSAYANTTPNSGICLSELAIHCSCPTHSGHVCMSFICLAMFRLSKWKYGRCPR